MNARSIRRTIPGQAICIIALLLNGHMDNTLLGQEPPPSEYLHIAIIDGDGFTNNIKKHTPREPIVEVRDRNNSPVPGATVVFMLPNSGAGGTFANGSHLVTVTTDQAGRASTVFRPNSVAGQFKINVTASYNGQTATATLSQTNSAVAASTASTAGAGAGGTSGGVISGTTLAIIGGIAGAAAVTAVAVIKGTGSSGRNAKIGVGGPVTVQ